MDDKRDKRNNLAGDTESVKPDSGTTSGGSDFEGHIEIPGAKATGSPSGIDGSSGEEGQG